MAGVRLPRGLWRFGAPAASSSWRSLRNDRPEDELAIYDDLVARFGEATEPALREQVAKALFYKGITLMQLDRREDELTATLSRSHRTRRPFADRTAGGVGGRRARGRWRGHRR